jgi:hypothetical protein
MTLKMKAVQPFETSETMRPTAWRYIPEDLKLQQHYCENFKSVKISVSVYVKVKGKVPVHAVKACDRSG